MCGIAGILRLAAGEAPRREELQRMIAQLHHRGPDGTGFHIDGVAGLAHARLAIIDIDGGGQPIHNESNDVWLAFNGEIFNGVALTRDAVDAMRDEYIDARRNCLTMAISDGPRSIFVAFQPIAYPIEAGRLNVELSAVSGGPEAASCA